MRHPGLASSHSWCDYLICAITSSLTLQFKNPLTRASQTAHGQPVVIRVMATQDEGHEYLSIIRKVSTSPLTLLCNNHCLPLLREFALEDIIFGVFPKTGELLENAWFAWTKNSVGDILDMFLQILEVNIPFISYPKAFKPNLIRV